MNDKQMQRAAAVALNTIVNQANALGTRPKPNRKARLAARAKQRKFKVG